MFSNQVVVANALWIICVKSCKKEDQGWYGLLIDRKGAGVSDGLDIENAGKLEKVEKFCYLRT